MKDKCWPEQEISSKDGAVVKERARQKVEWDGLWGWKKGSPDPGRGSSTVRELRSNFSKKEKINEKKGMEINKLGLTKKEGEGERNRKKIGILCITFFSPLYISQNISWWNGWNFISQGKQLFKKEKVLCTEPKCYPSPPGPIPMSDPSFPLNIHHADSGLDRFRPVGISNHKVQLNSSEQ